MLLRLWGAQVRAVRSGGVCAGRIALLPGRGYAAGHDEPCGCPDMTQPILSLPELLSEEARQALEALKAQAEDARVLVDPRVAGDVQRILAASPFLAGSVRREAGLLAGLVDSGDLFLAYAQDGFDVRLRALLLEAADEEALLRLLRRFRRREMLRIGWRDLAGLAPTAEVLADLSRLADACVAQALRWHEQALMRRHGAPRDAAGEPVGLVVLGMGKLGGLELNYSSDIDLIFTYESEGETDGERSLANSQFFIRLGQKLIRALNEVSADGFVFRVDMRLRPYGDEGPLAMSFDGMELYYATQGREWERYALIKARVIAGDFAAGARLMDLLRPFVFRRYLDFGAFAQLREMKTMIEREMARKGMRDNIKLGPGGIREVEFIGQLFQLIRGGRERRLQARGILAVLDTLAELGELPDAAVVELKAGYDFLRRAENRLQMMHDQQTQVLPEDEADRARLALAMGYPDWTAFDDDLRDWMLRVHGHFGLVFRVSRPEEGVEPSRPPLDLLWRGELGEVHEREALREAGFVDPEAVRVELSRWKQESSRVLTDTARARLDALMPSVLAESGASEAPEAALSRVLNLLGKVLRRSVYLALLAEHPPALAQLVRLCAVSPWIAELIAQHPILLDELIDPRTLYNPPGREGLVTELDGLLANIDGGDEERVMDELRRFRQLATLRVAAADIVDALPLMRVSDHLTWIAELILERTLKLAWNTLAARHGVPVVQGADGPRHPGFAVIAYGKLGGIELGYGSDLDLVFLHDSEAEGQTDGERPLDNAVFFARLAQRIMHMLSTRTAGGILYEVDTRLRPDGAAGLLVSRLRAFADYQMGSAWTWEHQALVRARPVAGSASIAEGFATIRRQVLIRPRDVAALREEVVAMREKMRAELGGAPAGFFHLKKDRGGITDIEFLVQYLILAHAPAHPELLTWTDNIRQMEGLARAGVLDETTASALIESYRELRDMSHHQVLRGERAVVPEARVERPRQAVLLAWTRYMQEEPGGAQSR